MNMLRVAIGFMPGINRIAGMQTNAVRGMNLLQKPIKTHNIYYV
jgi:hypothetical protein